MVLGIQLLGSAPPRLSQYSQNSPVLNPYPTHKALPGFFLCIFSSLNCLKKLCFQQGGSSALEGTHQAVLGSSDQQKVLASLSLFLKSEKISALLSVGKGPEYRRPIGLGHRSQITKGPVLRTFSYNEHAPKIICQDFQ